MADFLVRFPGFTPAAYYALTLDEHAALIAAFERYHR